METHSVSIKHAYPNVPVHPSDRHLNMMWQNQLYVNTTLLFWLTISTKEFYCTGKWPGVDPHSRSQGNDDIVFFGRFLTIGIANSSDCENNHLGSV